MYIIIQSLFNFILKKYQIITPISAVHLLKQPENVLKSNY